MEARPALVALSGLLALVLFGGCGGSSEPSATATRLLPSPATTSTTTPFPGTATPTAGAPTPTMPRSAAPTTTQTLTATPAPETTPTGTATPALCGNGDVDGDEQCDDGNAVGGDGCAANCTVERRSECVFSAGTSATIQTKLFAIPLGFTGQQTLTTGSIRNSDRDKIVPVVLKAEDVHYDPVSVPGLVCACVRSLASPALNGNAGEGHIGCGDNGLADTGYLYSVDHNIGVVGQNGFTANDCADAGGTVEDGSTAHPHSGVCNGAPVLTFSGHGGQGSSLIESNTAISLIVDVGACVTDGSGDPALYGPDGSACTADDPRQAEPSVLTSTSGTATAQVLDALDVFGAVIGSGATCGLLPCQAAVTGSRVSCDDLTAGTFNATMVTAATFLDSAQIRDNVVTSEIVCTDGGLPNSTPTPHVPARTPTPTPPGFGRTTTTVYAGNIQGMAGQTVSVPIGMNVRSGTQVATMQFNLTVVPNGSAPALATQITFTSNVGAPIFDLDNGLSSRLVGWFSNFSPVLTGTVEVGTLDVVIPADARAGDSYAVQVLNPSGTPDSETDLPMIGEAGRIEVVVSSQTPNATPTPKVAE